MAENIVIVKYNDKKEITRRVGRYVPVAIARDILLRLPPKSAIRFKSVCKNWRDMISDPGFEDINFQRLISKISFVYELERYEPTQFFYLRKLEERGTRARIVTSLCFEGKSDVWAEKSCNNLILFGFHPYDRRLYRLYLYDTITHRQKELPQIPKLGYFKSCTSLIFDACGQIYKVVVLSTDYRSKGLITCYIYSLNFQNWNKEEKWRRSKPPRSQKIWLGCIPSVALNGIFYWIADTIPTTPLDTVRAFIQPMNIATEEFREIINVPCRQRREFSLNNYSLLEIKGSLCLTYAASNTELEIWVLKDSVESVWINQYKISLFSIVNRPSTLMDFRCRFTLLLTAQSCNSTTYILICHRRKLYWYNMDTQEMRLVDIESGSHCYLPIVSLIG